MDPRKITDAGASVDVLFPHSGIFTLCYFLYISMEELGSIRQLTCLYVLYNMHNSLSMMMILINDKGTLFYF